jgi:CheY-like chemotaxis protein
VPDVIFLDIGLPVMNRYAVARAVRDLPELSHVYIAAVTGWGKCQRWANHTGAQLRRTRRISSLAAPDPICRSGLKFVTRP